MRESAASPYRFASTNGVHVLEVARHISVPA